MSFMVFQILHKCRVEVILVNNDFVFLFILANDEIYMCGVYLLFNITTFNYYHIHCFTLSNVFIVT